MLRLLPFSASGACSSAVSSACCLTILVADGDSEREGLGPGGFGHVGLASDDWAVRVVRA